MKMTTNWRRAATIFLVGLGVVRTFAQTNAPAAPSEPAKTEADYRNWVELGFGGTFIDGDKAAFMQRTGIRRDAWHWDLGGPVLPPPTRRY